MLLTSIESRAAMPHMPTQLGAPGWVNFINCIKTFPRQSQVDYMARGWDGITTHYGGLADFIKTFGAGYNNVYNFQFNFAFFQHRGSTVAAIQQLFGYVALY